MEILTSPKTYSPHITLARIPQIDVGRLCMENISHQPIAFRPALGRSTEYGVFIEALKVG